MSKYNGATIVSISKKTVKPSSPTPSSLNHHNLSYIDHLASYENIPVVYFYPNISNNFSHEEITQLLENSLSKALTSYYPFAGTIRTSTNGCCFVECNDVGAEFIDVGVSCSMSEILKHNPTSLVFPEGLPWNDTTSNGSTSLVTVQVTHFESCGGIAISVCIPHKIGDAYSVSRFMSDWAAIARDLASVSPLFDTCSFFPPAIDGPPALANLFHAERKEQAAMVSKQYHLSSTALSKLRATVVAKEPTLVVQEPTSVELVTALFYKAAAAATNSGGSAILCNAVDWRPPLHPNTVGNAFFFFVESTEGCEMQVPNLVARLRKAEQVLRSKLTVADTAIPKELIADAIETFIAAAKHSQSNGIPLFLLSDASNMNFYGADFGLGKPSRVIGAPPPIKNNFILGDTPTGDGIEIMVSLEEAEMSIFQCDQELLQYASLVVLDQ